MSEYTTIIVILENDDRIEDAKEVLDHVSTPRRQLFVDDTHNVVASRMGGDQTNDMDTYADALENPYLLENPSVFESIEYRRLMVFHYEDTGSSYTLSTRAHTDAFSGHSPTSESEYEWTELPRLHPKDYDHHPTHHELIVNISSTHFNSSIYP